MMKALKVIGMKRGEENEEDYDDLAKNVIHAVCYDEHGKVVRKYMLKRPRIVTYFTILPPVGS